MIFFSVSCQIVSLSLPEESDLWKFMEAFFSSSNVYRNDKLPNSGDICTLPLFFTGDQSEAFTAERHGHTHNKISKTNNVRVGFCPHAHICFINNGQKNSLNQVQHLAYWMFYFKV